MMTKDADYTIEYQSYLPILDLEEVIDKSQSSNDIKSAKSLIMTYIFSLKKENRNLHKRLNDRVYHNRRSEEEHLKTELKYLPILNQGTASQDKANLQRQESANFNIHE